MKKYYAVIGILLVLALLSPMFIYRASAKDVSFIVKEKERIVKGEESYYLVWGTNGKVYKNDDSLSFWKFNSSDIYGELEVGKEYNVIVAGWRIRFLSMYENIILIKE